MVRLAGFEYRRWRHFGCASTAGLNPLVPERKARVEPIVLPRLIIDGTPGRIRTCDLRIRSPLLYPTELQAHKSTGWLTQDTGEVYKKKNERTTLSITVATFEKCYLE